MKTISKVVGINLLVLLLYTVLIHLYLVWTLRYNDAPMMILIVSVLPIALQVLINFVVSVYNFVTKNNELGKAHLLSALVILIVGFSSCWGSSMLSTTYR